MKKIDKTVIILSIIIVVLLIIFIALNSRVKVTLMSDGKVYKVIKAGKHEEVTLPEPDKEGYDFDGWYDGDNYYSHVTIFKEKTTLNAKWLNQNRQEITVYFASDSNGKIIKTINLKCGGIIGDALFNTITPIKEGYFFQYWVDEKGNKVLYDSKIECRDMTLTAIWKESIFKAMEDEQKD